MVGADWIVVDERLVEVEPYVEHEAHMDTWERLEAGLPSLGRIHAMLRGLQVSPNGADPPASNHVESVEARTWTARATAKIRTWVSTPAERQLADRADDLARLVEHAEQGLPQRPWQLVHGDFWDNNVFFRDGRVVAVTDFDFMGVRPRVDDIALTLYYTNSTFTDDQVSDDRVRLLRGLVDAYDSGLDVPLSETERVAMPLALARMPLAFIGMIASQATEQDARELAAAMAPDIAWALEIVRDSGHWQEAFVR